MSPRTFAVSLALLASSAPSALGADISILDSNALGQGLNDPTPVDPVGLNFGTTRGQQAIIALQYAATIWGATLRSPVPIVIDSAFATTAEDPRLTCSSSSGILGITGAASFISGPQFPVPGAAYPAALANALSGSDATPGEAHILSRFNASIGTPACLPGQSYYYGLTGNPAFAQYDLVTVFLHEFAHGLGFLSFVDAASGSFGGNPPSIFDFHVWDVAHATTWQSETDAQREALADAASALSLEGPALAAAVPEVLQFLPLFSVDVPGVQNPVPFARAAFSGPFFLGSADVVAAQPLDGCSELTNAEQLAGNIALIQRSVPDAGVVCHFSDKANRAQDAGAAAVVFFNYLPDAPLVTPSGSTALSIPVGFVSLETGTSILQRAAVVPVTGTFGQSALRGGVDPSGTRVLLYTPGTVVSASSVSHFDTSATPAVLMEPSIEPSVRQLDLTPAVLSDLGWAVVQGLSVGLAKALEQQVYPGQDAIYLLTLINRRQTAASNVSLSLELPAGVSVVSTAGACPTGAFPCSLGTVSAGAVLLTLVTLHVPAGAASPFIVTASVNASNESSADVLQATSELASVTSTGCSTSGGAPALLAVGLLALLRTRRPVRRATGGKHRHPTGTP
ncbi:MAG: PA domain-containing protein [Myxococcaceae bacterium]